MHVFVTKLTLQCHKSSSSNHFDHSSSETRTKPSLLKLKLPKSLCCDISTIRFPLRLLKSTPPDSIALSHPTCEDQVHIRSDPPTPHSSEPEAKEQVAVSTGEDVEPEQAENASKNDHEEASQLRDMSSCDYGETVLIVPPTTRKERRAYKNVTPVPRLLTPYEGDPPAKSLGILRLLAMQMTPKANHRLWIFSATPLPWTLTALLRSA